MELKKTPRADLQNKKGIFLQIGLCVSLLFCIGMFAWSQKEVTFQDLGESTVYIEEQIVEITREEEIVEPQLRQTIQVVSDILNIVRDDKELDNDFSFDIDDGVDVTFNPPQAGSTAPEAISRTDEPFVSVEQMPRFQGGDLNTFRTWVQRQLKYPDVAQRNNIQGRVTLAFVIERNGKLTNIEVLASPDRSLSDEAVRVVSQSPEWTPGRQNGQAVRVKFTLPLEFVLR